MKNIPYGQSSAKLPFIRSSGHLLIWSSIRSSSHVILSSCQQVILSSVSFCHPIIMSFQHYYRLTDKQTTFGSTGLLRRQIDNNYRCMTCSPHHSPPGRCRVPRPVSRCCRTWGPGGSLTRARSSQHLQQRCSSIVANWRGIGSFLHNMKHTQYSAMTIDIHGMMLFLHR